MPRFCRLALLATTVLVTVALGSLGATTAAQAQAHWSSQTAADGAVSIGPIFPTFAPDAFSVIVLTCASPGTVTVALDSEDGATAAPLTIDGKSYTVTGAKATNPTYKDSYVTADLPVSSPLVTALRAAGTIAVQTPEGKTLDLPQEGYAQALSALFARCDG